MLSVLIMLGLKWLLIVMAYIDGTQSGLFAFPILGFGGSSFLPIAILGGATDALIVRAVFLKNRRAIVFWLVVSFIATFASGWVDILLSAMVLERSNSGNALQDTAADQFRMMSSMAPGVLVEMALGFVYLIIDSIWHGILAAAGLKHALK